MNTAANRRQYARYMAEFSAKYTVKEGKFRDLISNVGAGGVFVITRRKISLGRSINIQFPIFALGKRLSVMGTVVRCDAEGFAVMFNETIEEGLLKNGQFPGSANENHRSTTEID